MPKNLILGLIYAHLSRGTIFFYKTSSQILFQAIILCNLKENQSTKLQKMVKNLTSGPIDPTPPPSPKKFFLWVLPPLDVRYCRKLSLHAIFRKMKNPNSVKWWETSFFILFQKPASSVNRYHVQLSSCTISEKTNDPILRKQ